MLGSKPIILAAVAFAVALAACSGAAPRAVVDSKKAAKPSFESVTVPARIEEADRDTHEAVLFLLPPDHPERAALRDRLAQSYARSFERTPQEDHARRLALFEGALALHEPADFDSGRIADAVVPMAQWIVERYESLGDEAVVLAGLSFLALAKPGDAAIAERHRELTEWSESVRRTIDDDVDRLSSVTALQMKVVSMVPDSVAVERLAQALVRRHEALVAYLDAMEEEGGGIPSFMLRALFQEGGVGRDLIHIHFLAGEPLAALPYLRELGSDAGASREQVALLEALEKGDDLANTWFELAMMLGRDEPRSALRACAAARRIAPEDPRFPMCLGQAFERMGRPWSAVEQYALAAREIDEDEVAAQIMELVREAIFEIHRLERQDRTTDAIALADEMAKSALREGATGDEILRMSAAGLLFACGVVKFDEGDIAQARAHLERAAKAWPGLLWAAEKVIEIDQLGGRHEEAIAAVTAILARGGDDEPDAMWRAKLLERRADSRMALLDVKAATSDYREALVQWGKARVPDDSLPQAAFRIGVIHDRLGELEESRRSFRKAIRLDPDRRSTYADLISYLVTRRRVDDAVEIYRLAFNQDRIEPMWKIYYSMWVDGLFGRSGAGACDLAAGYLEQSDGRTWQDDLARFYSGRMTLDDLRKKAKGKGQEVEADFYAALKAVVAGREDEARALLERVVRSDLMGFFEYRMAKEMLSEAR